ncbi:hypothetical protein [Tateyamaria pelophila]|uniref:hypothetical protein n=1 Tax=Tateyamaria pelophila TaxID=328415 RepID=UPI001CC06C3F|nr:hypothetical protein [Tateyamaria pelophila]
MAEGMERGGDKYLLANLVLGDLPRTDHPAQFLVVLIGVLSGTSISALLASGVVPGVAAGLLFFVYAQFVLWRDTSRDIVLALNAKKGSVLEANRSVLPFSNVISAVLGADPIRCDHTERICSLRRFRSACRRHNLSQAVDVHTG